MSIERHPDARLVLIFVFLVLGSHAASGQRGAQSAPGRAKSLSCVFPVLATANLEGRRTGRGGQDREALARSST